MVQYAILNDGCLAELNGLPVLVADNTADMKGRDADVMGVCQMERLPQ